MGRGQGDHVGVGQPITFKCPIARRAGFTVPDWNPGDHSVTRTGRTRPARSRGRYTYVLGRMLDTEHEYICQCGYTGWTKHRDVLRYPIEEHADG